MNNNSESKKALQTWSFRSLLYIGLALFLALILYPSQESQGKEVNLSEETVRNIISSEVDRLEKSKKQEVRVEPASISIFDKDVFTRADNGAFYIHGQTTNNCSRITVKAENSSAGIFDLHQLQLYKYGDVFFKYGVNEDWENVALGTNKYTFTAYCDGGQMRQITSLYTLSVQTYNTVSNSYSSSYNYQLPKSYSGVSGDNYGDLSNDNYYTNSEGVSVHSPAYSIGVPAGASAKCKDGTYSFSLSRRGTCSHHGGVSSWY